MHLQISGINISDAEELPLHCRNVIHGSDSVESATKEIGLWFPEGPTNWQSSLHQWIYE